jgi:hypothetical protein
MVGELGAKGWFFFTAKKFHHDDSIGHQKTISSRIDINIIIPPSHVLRIKENQRGSTISTS